MGQNIGSFLLLMKGQSKVDWCCLVFLTCKIIENKARACPMAGHSKLEYSNIARLVKLVPNLQVRPRAYHGLGSL